MSSVRKSLLGHDVLKREHKMIEDLQLQLQAQVSRASYLQSRLTSTMDTMDTLRLRYGRELAAERETKEKLRMKIDRLVEYTAKVELQRDELRECVAALIEKVEVSHDFPAWPQCQISLLESLEPVRDSSVDGMKAHTLAHARPGAQKPSDHYPTIIALLRSELKKERASHARTHSTAEIEILTLRAQLARREAELEACVAHSTAEHRVFAPEPESTTANHRGGSQRINVAHRTRPEQAHASRLTPEEASQLLGLTAARNRRLEAEVKQIASRLERAKAENASPLGSSTEAVPARCTEVEEDPQFLEDLQVGNADDDNDTVVNPLPIAPEPKTPKSPNLQPVVVLDMPSPFCMTPQHPPSPLVALSPSIRNLLTATGAAPHEQQRETEPSVVYKLEEQIGRLAAEIDAFKVQRDSMSEWISRERQASSGGHEYVQSQLASSQASSTVQEEDLEQSSAVLALRSELERMTQNATLREAELLEEIRALREAAERSLNLACSDHFSPFTPAEVQAESSSKHEEVDDNGERSMELETPLQSRIIVSMGTDASANTEDAGNGLDPAWLIPLPPSPALSGDTLPSRDIHDRPPTPFSVVPRSHEDGLSVSFDRESTATETTPYADFDVESNRRFDVLERELADARKEVTERDVKLVELHGLINDLRLQMKDAGLSAV
ncbi:hypothetical protein BC835DRAFT_1365502 [Cytidiella melzeri]|nr:hypothetical protein BC835DRAFT_1365502 [Cytidiella melzeri]